MNYALRAVFSYSILLPGIIAAARFKKVSKDFYPFFFLIWLGIFNETLSFIFIKSGLYTIVNNNIYVLLESLLLLWFFKKMGLFKKRPILMPLLAGAFLSVWLFESFVFRTINEISLYFRIFYSFVVVLLSINLINSLLVTEKKEILKNAAFLICTGFIVYFTFKVLVNSFWLYGLSKSETFRLKIYHIMVYINFFTNFIYALAVLWIPKKLQSLLPY